jgi:cell division septation protein DedD
MQGRAPDASSIASAIAGAPKAGATALSADRRREARFLVWLCAEAVDKASAASALASEFPGSPEALIAAGSASTPPLPHWYLGGLDAAQALKHPAGAVAAPAPSSVAPAAVASAAPAAAPAGAAGPKPASPSASTASTAQGKRLQVGYFSREDNAQALKEELGSKGFAAVIEPRMRAVGAGKAEEKRWIVVVEGGKDIAKTLQSLKDAGYESYMIE